MKSDSLNFNLLIVGSYLPPDELVERNVLECSLHLEKESMTVKYHPDQPNSN